MTTAKNNTIAICHAVYAFLLIAALFIVIYLEFQDPSMSTSHFMLVCLICLLLLLCNVLAMQAVKTGTAKGRLLSRIMAILMLPNLPIGLVLGLIILFKTTDKHWESTSEVHNQPV